MRFYVATTLTNHTAASYVINALVAAGHECTYDWTTHGPAGHLGEAFLRGVAEKEIDGIRRADYLIVLLPGARGTHVELGVAHALKKQVIINDPENEFVVNNQTCAFYWTSNVWRSHLSVEDFTKVLLGASWPERTN